MEEYHMPKKMEKKDLDKSSKKMKRSSLSCIDTKNAANTDQDS